MQTEGFLVDKLQLVLDTFSGLNDERILFSFWRHFPLIDLDPDKLAKAHIDYYNRFNFDLMKISLHGRYPCVDFGCQIADEYDPVSGSTRCVKPVITKIEDWENIEQVDVNDGEFGKQLRVVELINRKLEFLPKINTIFSPLMVASKLDRNIEEHIKREPKIIFEALNILYEVISEFSMASLDFGAEGLFIASQHLRPSSLTNKEINKFELFFIEKLIKRVRKKSPITVFHIHGENILFREATERIITHAYNWHDQLTWPSLSEASEITKRGFLAGINEEILVEGNKEEIINNIRESLEVTAEIKRNILAPGCVIPLDVEEESLDLIVKLVNDFNKKM